MTESANARKARVHQEVYLLIVAAKDVPCARCKQRYPTVCMDFDHLPEYVKTFGIGNPSKWTSAQRVKDEIKKCQLLCSNCHRIVTWERKNGQPAPAPSGGPSPSPSPNPKNKIRNFLTAAARQGRFKT